MGSLLQILGNHDLEFNSGKRAVQLFEDRLNIEVKNGTYQTESVKNKIDDIQQIKFFTAYDFVEENYEKWKEVKILTNYKYCSEISIFEKVIRYENACKYSYWKNCMFNEIFPEDRIKQYEFCVVSWKRVNDLSIKLTRLLGGETLIYFDDSRFQNEEDIYHQGESIKVLIDEMSKKWIPTAFEDILNRKEEFNVRNGWYINKIK